MNDLRISGDTEEILRFIEDNKTDGEFCFKTLFPEPEYANPEDWYEWRVQNWGTKWDVDGNVDVSKIDDNNIEYDALFMRGKNDYRKSPVVKSDLIEEMKCHDYIPVYAIEDRDDCIDMFNSLGIFTLKVYNSVPA